MIQTWKYLQEHPKTDNGWWIALCIAMFTLSVIAGFIAAVIEVM